jgi:hypothetical protein
MDLIHRHRNSPYTSAFQSSSILFEQTQPESFLTWLDAPEAASQLLWSRVSQQMAV